MLTEVTLKSLKSPDTGKYLYDGNSIRGLVRENKSGISVSFNLRFKLNGKADEISLGTWPRKSLKEIRATAIEAKNLLASGLSPNDQRRLEKEELRSKQLEKLSASKHKHNQLVALQRRQTIRDLFTLWQRLALKNRIDQGKEVTRMFKKDVLEVIGDIAVEDVRKVHINLVLNPILERGANRMAKVILSLTRQMFRFAQDQGMLEFDPTASIRKAKIGGADNIRDRILSDKEIRELVTLIPNANLLKSTEAAIWIMLSTLARIGEVCKAEWSHINLDTATWIIPAQNSKNGLNHEIHLSEFAIRQFNELLAIKSSNRWLFPNNNDSSHVNVKSISKQIGDRQRPSGTNVLKGRTKLNGSLMLSNGKWTPHDLRRTGATIMGELGIDDNIIEKCLNHIEKNRIKRTYQHQRRKTHQINAWGKLGEHLSNLLEAGDNVVSIRDKINA